MAETIAAISAVASVIQLADFGCRLSVKLFTFGETVYTADKSIRDISNDVSLTSTVLKELGNLLQADEGHHLVSDSAVAAASKTATECLRVFEELDAAVTKSMVRMGMLGDDGGEEERFESKEMEGVKGKKKAKKGKLSTIALEKLKWPFLQPKMELLRSNLDRLKTSLSLMLQVLIYAKSLKDSKASNGSIEMQKNVIEALARADREKNRRFELLQRTIGSGQGTDIHYVQEDPPPGYAVSAAAQQPSVATFRSVNVTETPQLTHQPHLTSVDHKDTDEPLDSSTQSSDPIKHGAGELIICFNLLYNLLNTRLARINDLIESRTLSLLRRDLEDAHQFEYKRLEAEYGHVAPKISSRAANLALELETHLRMSQKGIEAKELMGRTLVAAREEMEESRKANRTELYQTKKLMDQVQDLLVSGQTLRPVQVPVDVSRPDVAGQHSQGGARERAWRTALGSVVGGVTYLSRAAGKGVSDISNAVTGGRPQGHSSVMPGPAAVGAPLRDEGPEQKENAVFGFQENQLDAILDPSKINKPNHLVPGPPLAEPNVVVIEDTSTEPGVIVIEDTSDEDEDDSDLEPEDVGGVVDALIQKWTTLGSKSGVSASPSLSADTDEIWA